MYIVDKILFKNFLIRALLLLGLALFVSSCNDSGCIEADDFGEYESDTLTIDANSSSTACEYDVSSPDIVAGNHGPRLKTCFTSGTLTLTDASGNDFESTTGCLGYDDNNGGEALQTICIEKCKSSCITNSSSGGVEPGWVQTRAKQSGRNVGVTIRPNSEISIRAVGTVILSGDISSPPMHVRSSNYLTHSLNDAFQPFFLDVRANSYKQANFSGQVVDAIDSINSSNVTLGSANTSDVFASTAEAQSLYNGSRRLAAYAIPHPAGYLIDASLGTGKDSLLGIPLFPDKDLWRCNFGNDSDIDDCNNLPYRNSGYNNVSQATDEAIADAYPLNHLTRTNNFGTIGGVVLTRSDEVASWTQDPFASVICNPSCSQLETVPSGRGQMLGDISASNIEIENNSSYAKRVSFKNLSSDSSCDIQLNVNISGNKRGVGGQNLTVFVNRNSWSLHPDNANGQEYIELEPEHSITISANSNNQNNGASCGEVIAYRNDNLLDIPIRQSSMVNFAILGEIGASGNCMVNARIINPSGTKIDDPSNDYDNDFYEYGSEYNVVGSSHNPVSLTVPVSALDNTSSISPAWSRDYFVRKGQILRFYPETWSGSFIPKLGVESASCGAALVMGTTFRPAFLCRGSRADNVNNPLCKLEYDSATDTKSCQAYAEECYEDSGPAFCVVESCQVANPPEGTGNDQCGDADAVARCQACHRLKEANGNRNPEISLLLNQCYDLENYSGKVANIDLVQGFSDAELQDEQVSKGTKKLTDFNGVYGNYGNFITAVEKDTVNDNNIYKLRQPMIFTNNSRLVHMFIEDGDFVDISNYYSGNNSGTSGVSYDGTNAFKIDISGRQEFKNGAMLEVKLCREGDSDECQNINIDPADEISSQPRIISVDYEYDSQTIKPTSYYSFTAFGELVRINNPIANGPIPSHNSNNHVNVGDFYYAHSESDDVNRIRLTFKIKDSDAGDCKITNPSLSDTCASSTTDGDICTGLVTKNPFYDENTISNSNSICGSAETPGSGDCEKEFYCANKYSNNSGEYTVAVRVKSNANRISSLIGNVVKPVIELLDGPVDGSSPGQAEKIYTAIVNDARYIAILNICMIFMITFYGITYLMGVSELSQVEIINRVIKIAIIYLFVSPAGWEWFDKIFVGLFKHGTDYLVFVMASAFDTSTELQDTIVNGEFRNKAILFSSVDKVFNLLFSSAVQKKISALLFASIFGIVYLIIMAYSLLYYVTAVAHSVLIYMTAQLFMSILFVVGPVFFILLLFNQTKEMFDKWLQQLMGFALQQVFLLTTLAFFNIMMYEVLKLVLGYRVCWDEVWVINIITRISLLSFWTIASLPPVTGQTQIGNIGNAYGVPSLFSVLFILVIAYLMKEFIQFMSDLAASIAGGIEASRLGSGVAQTAKGLKDTAQKYAGKALDKTVGQQIRKADDYFTDSGKIASQKRKQRKQQNKEDFGYKKTLAKAADKEVSKFKKENVVELAKMSASERQDTLKSVRDGAYNKAGKDLGLSDEKIHQLKTSKGLKFEGSTGIGFAIQATKQAAGSGGSLFKSYSGKHVSESRLKKSELKKAIKKGDSEDRKEIWQKLRSGEVSVGGKDPAKVSRSDIKEATKILEDEGVISRFRPGLGFARTDAEKALIREQARELREEREVNKPMSVDEFAKYDSLIKEANLDDAEREARKRPRTAARAATAVASLGISEAKRSLDRTHSRAAGRARLLGNEDYVDSFHDALRGGLQARLNLASAEESQHNTSLKSERDQLSQVESGSVLEQYRDAEDKSKDKSLPKKDRKQAKKDKIKISKSSDYKDAQEQIEKQKSNIQKNIAKKGNVEKRIDGLNREINKIPAKKERGSNLAKSDKNDRTTNNHSSSTSGSDNSNDNSDDDSDDDNN